MNQIISSTDVRKHWSEVIDTVVREKPIFVKRNRDILTFLSLEQLNMLLDTFKLHMNVMKEDDGSYTASMEEIDILCNVESKADILDEMIEELKEYAEEYMDNFEMYYHSKNRRRHFPYVYKVIAHENDAEKLEDMIEVIEVEVNA